MVQCVEIRCLCGEEFTGFHQYRVVFMHSVTFGKGHRGVDDVSSLPKLQLIPGAKWGHQLLFILLVCRIPLMSEKNAPFCPLLEFSSTCKTLLGSSGECV